MASARNPQFKDVPTLNETLGINYSIGAWRGIVAPKALPADITKKMIDALDAVYKNKEYTDYMSKRGFGVRYAGGADFLKFWEASDASLGAIMKKVGLAK